MTLHKPKNLKTPLRYPGGKSRAIAKMAQFLPDMTRYTEFREPFLGGGSVALYMSRTYPHLDIWVNDLYPALYNFWSQLQHDGASIADEIWQIKTKNDTPETARILFNESKQLLNQAGTSSRERAIRFYIINKCSFSGLTESSSFSGQASNSNFSFRGIEKLADYQELIQHWHITNHSYEELFSDNLKAFIYSDPPYAIKDNLYGHKGDMHKTFDHQKFAKDCDFHTAHQMISYNADRLVTDMFTDWNAYEYDLTYTMRSVGEYMKVQHDRKELLLTNYGIQSSLPS